ncbi:hypothetical protein CTAYLR_000793 [Chrysophaeum taylorii]|uniref:PPM-type phosphatase domain-containing protein n=1 Tax=Chrysophaeum taylorii TaxID=2483200 RepID=A0AAD7XS80_9STRA|nr:hypothetical protein CTAYLR_000793 [Chrysophaeum taylorii]
MGNLCSNNKAVEQATSTQGSGSRDADKTPQQKRYPYNWPAGAETVGYLTERQVKARMTTQSEQLLDLPEGFRLRWAAVSQRGYYPSQADKANQDAFAVHVDLLGPGKHWFSVYDGHGPVGEKCSQFARENVSKQFVAAMKSGKSVREALSHAHLKTNEMLAASPIDDQQSGTTAITVYVDGRRCVISNVGDSRAMLGSVNEAGDVVTRALSTDQTPYRRDERERVKKYGARVMTADQIDGVEPIHENWDCKLGDEIDDGGDPPRIWAQDQEYPGTAFTRSIGDSLAESLGVVAEPEIDEHTITHRDRVLICASDGIFEFITTKSCIEIALLYSDPLEACKALVGESYKLWIEREDRTDDITIILGFIEAPGNSPPAHVEPEAIDVQDDFTNDIPANKKKTTRRGSINNSAK